MKRIKLQSFGTQTERWRDCVHTEEKSMRIRRERFIFTSFILITLIVCLLFSRVKVFSWIALASYAAYFLYLYYTNKIFIVKYLAFIFSAVATVGGALIIELLPQTYLRELMCQSHFSGSLPMLILAYWIFLFVLELREYHYGNSLVILVDFSGARTRKIINLLSSLSGLILLGFFFYVATHSVMSVDRFNFYLTYEMPQIVSWIGGLSYLLLVFPMLAMVYGNRLIGAIAVGLYCAYNFWIGAKFGAFFLMLCIFFMVFYQKIVSINRRVLRRVIQCLAVIVVGLVMIAVTIMSTRSELSAYDYFSQRAAQQGQLWWKTYDLYQGQTHPAEFINEIEAWFEGDKPIRENVDAKYGIYKVMYLCAPRSLITAKLKSGSRYTQGDYAVVYYYFGFPGVVAYSILMGIVISGIVNSFVRSLQQKEYVRALIYLRFFYLIRVSFSMFTFSPFLDLTSLLSYLYLALTHGRHYQLRFGVKQAPGKTVNE